jgi:biopolymer transport protein ExbB
LLSIIQAAGWPIWPLLICSIAALALVIERFSSLRLARVAPTRLRAAFESAGRAAVHRLERYLNTLGTIASAAPLLGLMGTVIGMIEIFGSQAPSGSNPVMLAHGISIALYNTAFGLMIAIPTLMFYRYFRGLVDAYTLDMEQASDRLVPHLMRFAVPRSS